MYISYIRPVCTCMRVHTRRGRTRERETSRPPHTRTSRLGKNISPSTRSGVPPPRARHAFIGPMPCCINRYDVQSSSSSSLIYTNRNKNRIRALGTPTMTRDKRGAAVANDSLPRRLSDLPVFHLRPAEPERRILFSRRHVIHPQVVEIPENMNGKRDR